MLSRIVNPWQRRGKGHKERTAFSVDLAGRLDPASAVRPVAPAADRPGRLWTRLLLTAAALLAALTTTLVLLIGALLVQIHSFYPHRRYVLRQLIERH
jgi:hypothetical protein